MDSQTAETAAQKRDWSDKKIACEAAMTVMKHVLPMLSRFQYWITFLQTTVTPTMSLILYIIKDIKKINEDLANAASARADEEGSDAEANADAEIILSRIQVEFDSEFVAEESNDYLRLAQLLDPRVSTAESSAEVNSLLAKLVRVYADKPVTTLEVEGDQDMWGETEVGTSDMIIAEEIRLLKQHMQKIKVRKPSVTAGTPATVEYFGGVERQQDINFFSFYSGITNQIPHIGAGIRKICSHSTATGSCERSFNIAGNVLNIRRCSLDPVRAEKLILSAIRYKYAFRNSKSPRIPSIGVIEKGNNENDEDGEEEVLERQDDYVAAWEGLF